jgi:hypothetical protein
MTRLMKRGTRLTMRQVQDHHRAHILAELGAGRDPASDVIWQHAGEQVARLSVHNDCQACGRMIRTVTQMADNMAGARCVVTIQGALPLTTQSDRNPRSFPPT